MKFHKCYLQFLLPQILQAFVGAKLTYKHILKEILYNTDRVRKFLKGKT